MILIKKILVIRFSSLGDVILSAPLLKILRETFTNARIDYLTKKGFSDVLKNNPDINNLIETDDNINFTGLRELKKQIKQDSYDLIIDAHNNLRTFYLKLFLNSRKLKFKKYSFRKFLLVKFKIDLMKDCPPISERYCNILNPLLRGVSARLRNGLEGGLPAAGKGVLPEILADEISKQNTEKILTELNIPKDKKLICIVPSSKHFTKTYPVGYYAELINKFDKNEYAFILIGKGDDKKNIDIIKSNASENVYDLCDKLSILELAELMKKCTLVIGGDTGPMHIAEALNIPLIMIAGSSVKEFGFYPQNKKSYVFENNNLTCRPCSHIGRDSCPLGHFKCMKDVNPDVILSEAMNLLLN